MILCAPSPCRSTSSPSPLQVRSDDVARIQELEGEIRREEATLSGLRLETAGLQARAAALQQKIDGAGARKGGGRGGGAAPQQKIDGAGARGAGGGQGQRLGQGSRSSVQRWLFW